MKIFKRWRQKEPPGGGLACQEVVELVTDYLEGAMSEADRRRFEDHLAACDGCDTYLEQMRQTLGAMGRLEAESLPEHLLSHLEAAFRTWRPGASA
jgi:anti-sigma factor RsiW